MWSSYIQRLQSWPFTDPADKGLRNYLKGRAIRAFPRPSRRIFTNSTDELLHSFPNRRLYRLLGVFQTGLPQIRRMKVCTIAQKNALLSLSTFTTKNTKSDRRNSDTVPKQVRHLMLFFHKFDGRNFYTIPKRARPN